jgi:hypothetical protein
MPADSTRPGASPEPPEIDFCGLAASQGCKAVRVQSATALDDALRGERAGAGGSDR